MIVLSWSALGVSLGAAILFASLALCRTIDRTYLSFAGMMAFLAAFMLFSTHLYRAHSVDAATEAMRWQTAASHGFVACALVFLPAYTHVRLSRRVLAGLFGILAVFVCANLIARYGIWFAGPPTLVRERFLGEPYTMFPAQPVSGLRIAYGAYMLALHVGALVLVARLYRRGETQRAMALAISVMIIIAANVADVIGDARDAAWPYVTEFGLVALGIIMSIELAREFRQKTEILAEAIDEVTHQAQQLTSILGALRTLEDSMLASMTTLEAGMARLRARSGESANLERLGRAVSRLREVSSAMAQG
ncbi:MAG: hypothetical protein HOV81_19255 [Kofleriaceae bacterium]|nr:hypothetical protein [Kofleriaceae bacterium]